MGRSRFENGNIGTPDLRSLRHSGGLVRTLGGFSNFAISFTIISILTGVATLYDYGLSTGGPLEMTLGWPLATAGTLLVVLSMAELCSAMPTSGAMYDWAAALGGPTWAWFTAWFNIFGLVAAVAGVDYGCARFLVPMLGLESKPSILLLVYGLILFSHGLINHYGIRLVAYLADMSVTVQVLGVAVMIGALWFFAPKQHLGFLLKTTTSSPIHAPYIWLFLLGLLQAEWIYSGYDASAHVSEETIDAARRAPRGMVTAVVASGLVGYLLILSITWVIPDMTRVLNARDPFNQPLPALLAIVEMTLGDKTGTAVLVLVVLTLWFCGLSCVTSLSRTIYAFGRDKGLPVWRLWSHIGPKHHTPAPAIWLSVAMAFALLIYSGALSVIASMDVLGFYLSYFIPIYLGWRKKSQWVQRRGPWHLGGSSNTINLLALIWTVFICVIMVMPPNTRAGFAIAAVILIMFVLHRIIGRREQQKQILDFAGPESVSATEVMDDDVER